MNLECADVWYTNYHRQQMPQDGFKFSKSIARLSARMPCSWSLISAMVKPQNTFLSAPALQAPRQSQTSMSHPSLQ